MTLLFGSLLNNSFLVERLTRTGDGQGGYTKGYSTVATVKGRIRPVTGKEREVAALEEREISHVLYLFAAVDIARGDRVTCGDLVVEVQGVREPSEAGHHLEVDCMERQLEVSA